LQSNRRFDGGFKPPLLEAFTMSKAFTRDENEGPEIPDVPPTASLLAERTKNYITPEGANNLRAELQRLVEVTRPELADARDDPEAKRQLARIDQRIIQLEESLQSAEIVARNRRSQEERPLKLTAPMGPRGARRGALQPDAKRRTISIAAVQGARTVAFRVRNPTQASPSRLLMNIEKSVRN
jgi:hypothetical protein